eukprot:7384526-Prymnesium_polylepis.1
MQVHELASPCNQGHHAWQLTRGDPTITPFRDTEKTLGAHSDISWMRRWKWHSAPGIFDHLPCAPSDPTPQPGARQGNTAQQDSAGR